IRELMDYTAHMDNVIHLEVGEPNVDTPRFIMDAAYQAMKDGFTHYTPNVGIKSVRESLATHVNKVYTLNVDWENIAITTGAVAAIQTSLLALVDRGEKVLIPDPGWPNYE